jgi:hypothetical protein
MLNVHLLVKVLLICLVLANISVTTVHSKGLTFLELVKVFYFKTRENGSVLFYVDEIQI